MFNETHVYQDGS